MASKTTLIGRIGRIYNDLVASQESLLRLPSDTGRNRGR